MKISDQELINSIFIQILKKLPKSITMNYVGGCRGLVRDDDFWKNAALSLHICERAKITNKITKAHLLNRIKSLLSNRKIISTHGGAGCYSYPLTFTLDDKRLLDAFYFSRNFWIEKGVNEKPVKVDNFENLCEELRNLLLEKFAGGEL